MGAADAAGAATAGLAAGLRAVAFDLARLACARAGAACATAATPPPRTSRMETARTQRDGVRITEQAYRLAAHR
jgi:hypothetical protein